MCIVSHFWEVYVIYTQAQFSWVQLLYYFNGRPTLKKVMNSNIAACKRSEAAVFPVWLLQETYPYLSTHALSKERRSMDSQQQQEGFAKLLLDSLASIPYYAKYNYANFFFFQ